MLSVEIKYHTFESVSHQRQLAKATNQEGDIYTEAVSLFLELWNHQPHPAFWGIRSSKLSEGKANRRQLSIFDIEVEPEEKA